MQRRGQHSEVAVLAGIPVRTLSRYINGKSGVPSAKLRKLAEVCGVSTDWLLTGVGDPAPDDFRPHDAISGALDHELFGRLVDAVFRLYQEERVMLAPIDLGRIASRKYAEITAATANPEERGAMIKLIVTQLRAEIRAAKAAPGTGKASA